MSGIDNLRVRLNYQGGPTSEQRFDTDKLRTLQKALLHSYQAETITLEDDRQFRCLLNKNKLSPDVHDKIISIPYKDICLNKERIGTTTMGLETIGMKSGDVFKWDRTDTYWIVYEEYLEEDSYFRADVRKCTAEVEVDGKTYHVYLRGPAEEDIKWNNKKNIVWNDMNYSLVMFITKNNSTTEFFHRFSRIKIEGDMWEVTAVNPYYGEGIIRVCLKETYNNSLEDKMIIPIEEDNTVEQSEKKKPYIQGAKYVYPYDKVKYIIHNADNGEWQVSNSKKAVIKKVDDNSIEIEIITGRSGQFDLKYVKNNYDLVTLPIVIKSL